MGQFVNDFFMICGYIDGRHIKSGFWMRMPVADLIHLPDAALGI